MNIILELPLDQVNLILNVLAEQPFRQVAVTLTNVQVQADTQVKRARGEAPVTAVQAQES